MIYGITVLGKCIRAFAQATLGSEVKPETTLKFEASIQVKRPTSVDTSLDAAVGRKHRPLN